MKLNRGFTLVELLAVIIILGVITVIAVPAVNKAIKSAKEELYQVQLNNIELGAKSWAADHVFDLPENDGDIITLTLGQLKIGGYVQLDIKNPKDNKFFPNDMEITVTRYMNNYLYDVLEDTGTPVTGEQALDLFMPSIILNGNTLDYVEFGTTYNDQGVIARSSDGTDITDQVVVVIKSNDQVVPLVDTTRFGQYKLTYTVTDNNKTASVIRTVMVRDTTPPVLTIPTDITITVSQVTGFDLMDGVSAIDNSGEDVKIVTSGSISSLPGIYTITYTATDVKDNEVAKVRRITVEEDPVVYTWPDVDGYIYEEGAEHEDKWVEGAYNASPLATATLTKETDHLFIGVSSSDDFTVPYATWVTTETLDLTGVSKIYFEFEPDSGVSSIYMIASSSQMTSISDYNARTQVYGNECTVGARNVRSIDVSAISGANYIKFNITAAPLGAGQAKLYRVWVE